MQHTMQPTVRKSFTLTTLSRSIRGATLARLLAVSLGVGLVGGCATHADIQMPLIEKVARADWQGKHFRHEVYYSQPRPGIFTGGDQLPLVPIKSAELSVASAATLQKLPEILGKNLPQGAVSGGAGDYDYLLEIELVAHDKKGPTYADFEAMKSFGKKMLSLGLASSEYDIIADFDVTYRLKDKAGAVLHERDYRVKDSVDHERGDFESLNTAHDYAAQLLEKHINLTVGEFLQEVPGRG